MLQKVSGSNHDSKTEILKGLSMLSLVCPDKYWKSTSHQNKTGSCHIVSLHPP